MAWISLDRLLGREARTERCLTIVSWNCNGAFRKKAHQILPFRPDLVIAQECEQDLAFEPPNGALEPRQKLWFGNDCNRGVGIFSYSDLELKVAECYDPRFEYVVPLHVSGPERFSLIAVWTKPSPEDRAQRYVGQVQRALRLYESLLRGPALIVGDFNWNKIWDRANRPEPNLMDVVEFLQLRGISSLYHQRFQEGFGMESQPTFYMHHDGAKGHHIDYCFGSRHFADRLTRCEVGSYNTWRPCSDHMPIVCTFQ